MADEKMNPTKLSADCDGSYSIIIALSFSASGWSVTEGSG